MVEFASWTTHVIALQDGLVAPASKVGYIWFNLTISMIVIYIAVCDPPCQNGGHCTSQGTCTCTNGWGGDHCEQGLLAAAWERVMLMNYFLVICSPPCNNGGHCVARGRCNCTENWQGPHCQQGALKTCTTLHCIVFLCSYLYSFLWEWWNLYFTWALCLPIRIYWF